MVLALAELCLAQTQSVIIAIVLSKDKFVRILGRLKNLIKEKLTENWQKEDLP